MKKLTTVLSIFLGLAFCAGSVKADTLQDIQERVLDARSEAEIVFVSSSVALNLTYVGSSTEALVTIAFGAITAFAPQGTADSSNFGVSAGSYAFVGASYDTMGELCDAIDALANYKCTLKGAKRDDNTTLLRDQTATTGTNDLAAVGGFDVKFDTGGFSSPAPNAGHLRIGITPPTGKRVLLKSCTANVNVIDSFNVYGKLRKWEGVSDGVTRNDTTLVWSQVTVDDTDLTTTWSESGANGLEFAKDAHVVIDGGSGTDLQAAANDLLCRWQVR